MLFKHSLRGRKALQSQRVWFLLAQDHRREWCFCHLDVSDPVPQSSLRDALFSRHPIVNLSGWAIILLIFLCHILKGLMGNLAYYPTKIKILYIFLWIEQPDQQKLQYGSN